MKTPLLEKWTEFTLSQIFEAIEDIDRNCRNRTIGLCLFADGSSAIAGDIFEQDTRLVTLDYPEEIERFINKDNKDYIAVLNGLI